MNKTSTYIKSPLNYIGGKYKLLPQLLSLFPEQIDTMVDLFAGGGDVFVNTQAQHVIANDINYHVIDIFESFKTFNTTELIEQIDNIIQTWHLSQTDEQSYQLYRAHYNKTKNPIELFVLICYSFNYQIRFNSRHEFNNPFGRNRSWFNPSLRENLVRFHKSLNEVELSAENFKTLNLDYLGKGDFVYADPPYLITTGTYNDGKRGFEGWTEKEEKALYSRLDKLHNKGVKFALSNVSRHKGRENVILLKWMKKYHVHYMNYNYKNSNYQARNTDKETEEILVTNY